MAKNTVLYEALLVDGIEMTEVQVDVFDLPYDKMGNGVRLMITDDVCMNASKDQQWPDFTNVDVVGGLDCCKLKITPATVLPAKFAWLDCQYAIGGLDVLMGKIPETCEEIYVRHALFNNIKNNKDGALDAARAFVAAYPYVKVLDGENSLSDLLREMDRQQVVEQPVPQVKKEEQVEVIGVKTDEWYSAEELIVFCRSTSAELATVSGDVLARLLKAARSRKVNLKLRSETKKRADGADVVCVHRDDVGRVVEYVVNALAEEQQRADAKKKTHKKADGKKQPVKTEEAAKPKKYYYDSKEIKVTKIKKYISKSVWRDLCGHCNKNVADLLRILNDINDVNVVPQYLGNTLGVVLYVKDNLVHSSPTLTFKEGKCITQSFGTLNDRPRLVWGIAGNVLVAQKLFPEHERKRRMEYNNYCSGLKVDLGTLDWSKYFLVTDLIKELTAGRGMDDDADDVSVTEMHSEEMVAGMPVSEDDVVEIAEPVRQDAVIDMVSEDEENSDDTSDDDGDVAGVPPFGGGAAQSKVRRPRITRTVSTYVPPRNSKKRSTDFAGAVDSGAAAIQVPRVLPEGFATKPYVGSSQMQKVKSEINVTHEWQQLYSLSHDYEKRWFFLDGQKRLLLGKMAKETKADTLLGLSNELRQVLVKMKRCEDAIGEMQNINASLHKLYRGMHRKK